ncbi:hypothetical protein [Thermoanaerobacter pentosaceus]|uniref:Uncharacterized protein n=1 Tax=Thermoanaerobacter pentosaceus TaxID=694059 RepID=A0ABT9M678_9THEO|nr:hypothetical protein [Thermoanaerobacter pentosaceus]MDP9751636.1 hypothetical protein [Thermoanaerobacter pentosaceus]
MNNSFKNDILIDVAAEAARQQRRVLTKRRRFDNIEGLRWRQRGTLKNEQ